VLAYRRARRLRMVQDGLPVWSRTAAEL